MIFDSINGVPVGAVVNPIGIANVTGVASQVVFSNFIPSVETASDGTLTTKFTVRSPGGATMENSVRLEKGGNLLLGKTVVTGSSVTATGSYEYSWRAAPYVPGGGTFH